MKRHIPNVISLMNLLSGSLSVVFLLYYKQAEWAAWLICIAAVFDFFDGFTARLLGAYSELGKQLDSLSDLVSFGLAPAFLLFFLLHENVGTGWESVLPFLSLFIALFSALRLGIFNIDPEQSSSFKGLPTPASALLIVSLVLIQEYQAASFLGPIVLNKWFFLLLVVLLPVLLVSKLPLFALKFKNYKFRGNEIRYVFVGLTVLLLILFQYVSVPIIILLYIILSVINNFATNH